MKLFNKLIVVFALSFVVFMSSCTPKYENTVREPYAYDERIGFSTENEPLESHKVTIYYGKNESEVDTILYTYEYISIIHSSQIANNYNMYGTNALNDFDHNVEFTIVRNVYESTKSKVCKSTIIYQETNKFSYYISDGFVYGKNSYVDTITKDDLFDNKDGYGYIVYTWYFTEDSYKKSKYSTEKLYYTIDDDKITFKIAKLDN